MMILLETQSFKKKNPYLQVSNTALHYHTKKARKRYRGLLTSRRLTDPAHVLRRQRQRAAGADARLALGMTGERVNFDCVAGHPGSSITYISLSSRHKIKMPGQREI